MFKLPMKFYETSDSGGGSSGTSASDKKYEITITQPPQHEPRPDFIRGIPYAAKDNVMFCKYRAITLDDVKEIDPKATTVPTGMFIAQDINGKDLVITSDMMATLASMNIFFEIQDSKTKTREQTSSAISAYMSPTNIAFVNKKYYDGQSLAMMGYNLSSETTIIIKISDVDVWLE